jgi:hypothetical protein
MVDFFPVMPQVRGGRAKIRPVNARDLGRAYYQCVMKDKLPELDYVCSGSRGALTAGALQSDRDLSSAKRRTFVTVPVMAVAGAAWCVKQVSRGKIDYVEKALRLSEDRVFDHEKATRDFGFEPEPFEFGLRREVEEYLHGKK